MAVDIFLNPITNDIDLTTDLTMRLTANIEESSRQQVLISLSTFKGEWFADVQAGIPYLRNDNNDVKALGEGTKAFIDALIQEDILARENIIEINSYESTFTRSTGSLEVTATATTASGNVIPVVFAV